MQKYLFMFFLNFLSNFCFSQENLKINIIYNNLPVSYASVKNVDTNQLFQTNENGESVIEYNSENDILNIFCLGYEPKQVKISDIIQNKKIELNQREEVLEEIIISVNKQSENKKWKVFGKKIKKNFVYREPIVEGCGLVSSFVIKTDVSVSGIRFVVYANPFYKDYLEQHPEIKTYKKILRPVFMINSIDINDNLLPNNIIELVYKEESEYLEIEFGKTLELKAGETISFGLELIPENLNNTIKNNLIGIATVPSDGINKQKTIMKTFKPKEIAEQICNSIRLDDIYFELKIEK